jgi:hypothetical protein
MPPGGYGVGLFDSSGPEKFAESIKKITAALTGVQTGFTSFGDAANKSLSGLGTLIDNLTKKLSDFTKQAQTATGTMGGGGGGGGGGARGAPSGGGSGGTGARDGSWTSPSSSGNPGGYNQGPLDTGQGTQPDGSAAAAQAKDVWTRMPEQTPKPANPDSMVSPGNEQGSTLGRAAGSMIPAAMGKMATSLQQGAAGNLVASAIQGASIGQMLAPAYGVSQKSLYVIPNGAYSQNPQDYAQANMYATTYMGAAPGTQNWSTVQKGANQLMTLMPNMTRQQAFTTMNQMQQPGTLNAGLMFGLNFKPGGKMMAPQQQYDMIYQKLFAGFPGGRPTGDQFQAYMAPGGPGENNLSALGITPGSDQYAGFMQYAQTKIGLGNKGMPSDIGTPAGAKAAGLNTPAFAQLQAQTAKSQTLSKAEPGIAGAATNLNNAASALLKAVGPLSSLGGGLIGKVFGSGSGLLGGIPGVGMVGSIGSHLPGVGGIIKSIFQSGGQVPGSGPQLAVVHGGEYVLTKDDVDKMQGKKGGHGAGAGGILSSVLGGVKSAAGGVLKGLEGGVGQAKDTVLGMLAGKPSDNPTTALAILLSPAPPGSPLAALSKPGGHQLGAGKTAAPAQTAGKGNAGVGGAPGAMNTNLLAGLGLAAGSPAAAALSQLFGGTTASTQPGAATGTAGGTTPTSPWNYKSAGVGASDVSGMFASTSTTQTSDGSGSGSGGSGGTGSGTPTNLSGSGNVQQAYNFFIGKGLKDFQSAGIVGNLAQESGVSPTSKSPGAFGVAQWTPPDALYAWAKAQNRDASSLATQLDFLWSQISPGGSEAGTLPAVQSSTDAASAAQAFEQKYERAGIPAMANRIKYANNILASKGQGYARGTQLIARNQLALLHRGEAVVSAADNYSSNPYNKGGSVGGSSAVHLNFKAGSIQLVVPANSTQQDMDALAKQFVAAISKPQNLASVRSS